MEVPRGVGGGGDEEGAGDVGGYRDDVLRVFVVRGDVFARFPHFHGVIRTTRCNYIAAIVCS